MASDLAEDGLPSEEDSIRTRQYQQEMLDESLERNIIIALDTGSGKTHIAILRLLIETQNEPHKLLWFVAPTVTLVDQQYAVIRDLLPVSVGMISGALQPDQWKDAALWQGILSTHKVVVSTPQVLLDALRNGYISLGRDVALIVFDEAHHAVGKHPMALIMAEHYFQLPARSESPCPTGASIVYPGVDVEIVRPMILGLTASPIFGTNVVKALKIIEENLDCTVRTARMHRTELARFVHRPTFKHAIYEPEDEIPFSTNLIALDNILESLNIHDDPYVKYLQRKLTTAKPEGKEWQRADQMLSKAIHSGTTFCQKGLRDISRTAHKLLNEIGAWSADWYVYDVVRRIQQDGQDQYILLTTLKSEEKKYLRQILSQVIVTEVSYDPDDIQCDVTDKVNTLITCLLEEKTLADTANDTFSCIVFVTERMAVLALSIILTHHPLSKDMFSIDCLVGISEDSRRNNFLDLTRFAFKNSKQKDVLMNFKIGYLNLVICTAVAEEGIDIQACGCVIRWDPPPNTASWAQSRGRARKQKSTFVLILEQGSNQTIEKWEKLEDEMVAAYNDPSRDLLESIDPQDKEDPNSCMIKDPDTRAIVNLDSVTSRLSHFCAVIPSSDHVNNQPLYDLDPLDYTDGWHALPSVYRVQVPYTGPWGASVTLPRSIPLERREFGVDRKYETKRSALRHAAFEAYQYLYHIGLLNKNLLPLSTTFDKREDEAIKNLLRDVQKRESTAGVGSQICPWLPPDNVFKEDAVWFQAVVKMADLPPLLLLTRSQPPVWTQENSPLFYPPNSSPISVQVSTTGDILLCNDPRVQAAREYTRQLFWPTCMGRMIWDDTDYCYLVYPQNPAHSEVENWIDWSVRHPTRSDASGHLLQNAECFGKQFSYPTNIVLVIDRHAHSRPFRFLRWHYDPISEEEEIIFRKQNPHLAEQEVQYPLLAVESLPPKVNYLVPRPPDPPSKSITSVGSKSRVQFLDPTTAFVILVSETDVAYSQILPSVFRALGLAITVNSMVSTVWPSSPLAQVQPSLLQTALLAPVAGEQENYQRLETLGDTVLKFLSGFQLLAQYPHWHEGYLAKKRDHGVANVTLAARNVELRLFRWVIRDRMIGKKFRPLTFSAFKKVDTKPETSPEPKVAADQTAEQSNKKKKKKAPDEELSTKVLADVVESVIGACYLHGGFDLAFQCCQFLGLGIDWEKPSLRIDTIISRTSVAESLITLPPQLAYVQDMLGYEFEHKSLLLEALTHGTSQADAHVSSYERLEFAGDGVLDMVVTEYVFRAKGKNYSPGHMFLRKSAMVNASILAYICLKTRLDVHASMPHREREGDGVTLGEEIQEIHLWQCIVHQSQKIMDDQRQTNARYQLLKVSLEEAFRAGNSFPWGTLTRLQAPKFFSDIIESLIGAVYVDSRGSMESIHRVLRKLGWLPILERIVAEEISVLHPVSQVSMWAANKKKKVSYEIVKEKGSLACIVKVDGEEKLKVDHEGNNRGRASEVEIRLLAAEEAAKEFHIRS